MDQFLIPTIRGLLECIGFKRRKKYIRAKGFLQMDFYNATRGRDDWFLMSAVDSDNGENLISTRTIAELDAKQNIQPLGPRNKTIHMNGQKLKVKGKIYLEWKTTQQGWDGRHRGYCKTQAPCERGDANGVCLDDGQRLEGKFRRTLFYVTDVQTFPFDATLSSRAVEDYKLVFDGSQEMGMKC